MFLPYIMLYCYKDDYGCIEGNFEELSISSDSVQLIAANFFCKHYYLVNTEENKTVTVKKPLGSLGWLHSVVWTPRGNIVIATDASIVVMSPSGQVIATTPMHWPRELRAFADDVFCVADVNSSSVRRSQDDGVTWSHVFNQSLNIGYLTQLIQLPSTDEVNDHFLISDGSSLRVYIVDKQRTLGKPTWRNITLPQGVEIGDINSQAYDCLGYIFVTMLDRTDLLVLSSVDGTYKRTLTLPTPSKSLKQASLGVAVSRQNSATQLYVSGLECGKVMVYDVIYADE